MARIYIPTQVLTTSPVGQLRLIQNAFLDLGSGTVKQITEHVVKGGLITKQDPTRVVMFYMIHLGKLGKVKEITEAEAKKTEAKAKETLAKANEILAKVKTTPAPTPKKTTAKQSSPKTTSC